MDSLKEYATQKVFEKSIAIKQYGPKNVFKLLGATIALFITLPLFLTCSLIAIPCNAVAENWLELQKYIMIQFAKLSFKNIFEKK